MSKEKIIKPEWFKPKKYDACANFSYLQWYEELYLRQSVLVNLNTSNRQISELSNEWIDYFKQAKFRHKSISLFVREMKRDLTNYSSESYGFYKDLGLIQDSLWSPTISSVFNDYKIIIDKQKKDKIPHDSAKDIIIKLSIAENGYKDLIKYDQYKSLTVDLLEDEKELVRQFKQWMKSAKTNFNIKSRDRISTSSLFDWSNWRILGFYDLMIWAKNNEIKQGRHGELPKSQIVKWLFEDIENTSRYSISYPRKLQELFSKLYNGNIIDRLYYLANKQECNCESCIEIREKVKNHTYEENDI